MYAPEIARHRAELYAKVRDFFSSRGVLEVETPILSRGISTDCHIDPFSTIFEHAPGAAAGAFYLQTSPELHMKRLLTQGFPSIFQICRVFRNGESGRIHNPEFTMLEWYRLGFGMERLVAEVTDLLTTLLGPRPVVSQSYAQAFAAITGIDPLSCSLAELSAWCSARKPLPPPLPTVTDALQFIMSEHIEPTFARDSLTVVHSFPAAQAVLAVIDDKDPRVARRFEIYGGGCELGNGYEELGDWQQNQDRMQEDNQRRLQMGKPAMPVDQNFIEALKRGLPACSGVAVGLDRVIMLVQGLSSLDSVIAFPWGEC